MSELDFLLKRREKRGVEREDSQRGASEVQSRESPDEVSVPSSTEYRVQSQRVNSPQTLESSVVQPPNSPEGSHETNTKNEEIERIMSSFLSKEPKVGVWSYPSYLVLQYLYSTVPGFKMSRTAKEAMELGLKQMYEELFQVAERVSKKYIEQK
jgi:hypothetical protein